MENSETLCSYGESLSETLTKLCKDVNRINARGWQVLGGVTIEYRDGFKAEQKLVKKLHSPGYTYDIVWVYATTIPRAKNELAEAVKQRIEKGWKTEGEPSEIKRVGIYSKNSEMWYLAQVMTRG